jgi:ferredoxin-NADP reductase
MQVVFDHVESESETIQTFFFAAPERLDYAPGQFVELSLPHAYADSRGTKRWFSLSSAPSDPLLSITTKFADHDGSTFKRNLRKLEPGSMVTISEAMGDFVLPIGLSTPLIFVAGGIGITPIRSMLRSLAAHKEARPIRLLYGVASEDHIIFQDTFEAAHQHATIVVADPSDAWGGECGHLTDSWLRAA